MTDITKCKGENCTKKHTCWRYVAASDKFGQSWSNYDSDPKPCKSYWSIISQAPPSEVTTGVRTNDPDTSYAAAAFIKDHVTHLQGLVMEFLNQRGEHGATTEEIARHYGIELGSITPRMAPLERMGVVRRTDLRRMAQGKKVGRIVWQSIKACPQ